MKQIQKNCEIVLTSFSEDVRMSLESTKKSIQSFYGASCVENKISVKEKRCGEYELEIKDNCKKGFTNFLVDGQIRFIGNCDKGFVVKSQKIKTKIKYDSID